MYLEPKGNCWNTLRQMVVPEQASWKTEGHFATYKIFITDGQNKWGGKVEVSPRAKLEDSKQGLETTLN